MSAAGRGAQGRRRRRAVATLAITAVAPALILGVASIGSAGTPSAQGQAVTSEVIPQTDAAVPAHEVVMLGASPQEAPDETWGIGRVGAQSQSSWAIVRYSQRNRLDAGLPDRGRLRRCVDGFEPAESQLAGSITPDGSGALLGSVPGSAERRQVLLVRDTGSGVHRNLERSGTRKRDSPVRSTAAPRADGRCARRRSDPRARSSSRSRAAQPRKSRACCIGAIALTRGAWSRSKSRSRAAKPAASPCSPSRQARP